MFATLDPVSRRLRFPREREVIITDTVGFIRDLPPALMQAFSATLEEISDADLLLHVVDATDPDNAQQIATVEKILDELGAADVDRFVVFNKCDRLAGGQLVTAVEEERFRRVKHWAGFPELAIRHGLELLIEYVHAHVVNRAADRDKRRA